MLYIQSCDGSRGGYIIQHWLFSHFCTLYNWQLMYVFDFVCFIPSKSQTIMPKSLTCGYSISIPDTFVVEYTTLHLHITGSHTHLKAIPKCHPSVSV